MSSKRVVSIGIRVRELISKSRDHIFVMNVTWNSKYAANLLASWSWDSDHLIEIVDLDRFAPIALASLVLSVSIILARDTMEWKKRREEDFSNSSGFLEKIRDLCVSTVSLI